MVSTVPASLRTWSELVAARLGIELARGGSAACRRSWRPWPRRPRRSGSTMARATASGWPCCSGQSAALSARPAIWRSLRSWRWPPRPVISCRTSPIRADFFEDDVVAGQGDQRGHADGAVVDVGHRLHVLDPRRSCRRGRRRPCRSTARAVDLEDSEVGLLLPGLLDPPGQVPTMTVSSGPRSGSRPGGAPGRASGRRRPTGRRSGRCCATSAGVSAVRLQKPSSRGPLRREDAAQAAVPGGPLLDHLVRLLERVEVLGQDVMHGLVGRPDQPEVGVAVEHPQEQVGVAGLADGQDADRLAIGRRRTAAPRG